MGIKKMVLIAALALSSHLSGEEYYQQSKREGLEIRITPIRSGEVFNFNFDFSKDYPFLEKLDITGGEDFDDYLFESKKDLGLGKNKRLKEIDLYFTKAFPHLLAKANLPSLESLSMRCMRKFSNWDFLKKLTSLKSMKVESVENTNLNQLLSHLSNMTSMRRLELKFDDYISGKATQFSNKELQQLAELTHLNELIIKYYRYMPTSNHKSEKLYFKKLEKKLRYDLRRTLVKVELIEAN